MSRAQTILSRLPRHLAADTPGKLFGDAVAALAGELDVKTYQLGRVRRAHALADADEEHDLLLHAGAHDRRYEDFEVLRLRLAALRGLRAALADPEADDTAVEAALERLPVLLGLPADAFPPFAAEGPVTGPARARLVAALDAVVGYAGEMDQLRRGVRDAIALHRRGNGTIGALIGAGASQLDLEVEAIAHDAERFWHIARCRDRLRLLRPEPPGSSPATSEPLPAADLIALEENPFRPKELDPTPRRHGDRFRIVRGGLEQVSVTIRVVGAADRTVWPMVVNLDAGFGVAFAGTVPDGDELRFESDGRVTMGGADVTPSAFTFRGAVFGDAEAAVPGREFVFDGDGAEGQGPLATFAVTEPLAEAFGPGSPPHSGALLTAATMALGESRWAYFVRVAHYGGTGETLAIPGFEAGVFDESVFDAAGDPVEPAGAVGFSWQEREPFAFTLWIPQRFQALDVEGALPLAERVRLVLDRHRPAGVHAYVKYADDRWSLAAGVLRDLDSADARGIVVVGTSLWPGGTPQPQPS